MRIDYIDPDDVPDEPGPSRPPDGPRSPDTAPPPQSDPVERDTARRVYQDLVNAAYADRQQPEMDVQHPTGGPWSRDETWQLSPEQVTEAAMARANSRDEGEQVTFPVMPQIEAPDTSRCMTGLERMHKGEESLYCPVSELKGDESGTAERLMESREFTGGTLQGFKDPTGNPDYIDEYKRTYDAVGGPSAWAAPELNMNDMINQIKRHLYQKAGVDFTVLDLTSASSQQIDEVFENLDTWAASPSMCPLSKLIILGEGF